MRKRPELTMMVGPSHSGKSTWIAKNGRGILVVSPDEIRKDLLGHQYHRPAEGFVWWFAYGMAGITLRQGLDVIVDATSVDAEKREIWVKVAKESGARTKIVYLKTPMEVCLARNASDEVKPIPEMSIRSMAMALEQEPPDKKEVDKLIVVEYNPRREKSKKEKRQ